MSDVHLEHGTIINIIPKAEYLLLAGDIGNPFQDSYKNFLADVSTKFRQIYMVAGNHEYYSKTSTMAQTEEQIKSVCPANVHFLQNESMEIPNSNIHVFGTTMWTHIPEEYAYLIQCYISDYRCIPGFSAARCNDLNATANSALNSTLKDHPDRKYILLCHHVPSSSLLTQNICEHRTFLDYAYSSDIECIHDPRIKAVVYGHTHAPSIVGKYYCNPVGYPDERDYSREIELTFTLEKFDSGYNL